MLVSDAVTQIKRQFGDEYGTVIIESDIYQYIYEAELDIIRHSGSNEQTTTALVSAFPASVPTNVTVKRLAIDGVALDYVPVEQLDQYKASRSQSANGSGNPSAWYTVNKTVYLWPQSTDPAVSVIISYNKTPTLMSGSPAANTFTVPESYHTDVINFALSRAFSKVGHTVKVKEHLDLYERTGNLRSDEAESPDAPIYKLDDPMDFNMNDLRY